MQASWLCLWRECRIAFWRSLPQGMKNRANDGQCLNEHKPSEPHLVSVRSRPPRQRWSGKANCTCRANCTPTACSVGRINIHIYSYIVTLYLWHRFRQKSWILLPLNIILSLIRLLNIIMAIIKAALLFRIYCTTLLQRLRGGSKSKATNGGQNRLLTKV
jgi:hypothetical protein